MCSVGNLSSLTKRGYAHLSPAYGLFLLLTSLLGAKMENSHLNPQNICWFFDKNTAVNYTKLINPHKAN